MSYRDFDTLARWETAHLNPETAYRETETYCTSMNCSDIFDVVCEILDGTSDNAEAGDLIRRFLADDITVEELREVI